MQPSLVDAVTRQQRQPDFRIQSEFNEGKKQFCKLEPSSWLVPGNGRSQGQEGRRGTKGHRREVVKGAAQVWRVTQQPLPSKSRLQIQTELQHVASVTINFTGESDVTEEQVEH